MSLLLVVVFMSRCNYLTRITSHHLCTLSNCTALCRIPHPIHQLNALLSLCSLLRSVVYKDASWLRLEIGGHLALFCIQGAVLAQKFWGEGHCPHQPLHHGIHFLRPPIRKNTSFI